MRRRVALGGVLLLTLSLYSQESYKLQVNVVTSDSLGRLVWSSLIERPLEPDRGETLLFEAENGSLAVTLSLHPIDEERLLLVAGSDFRPHDSDTGSLLSANLKSISLKKDEKVVYYPLGRNEETNEGETQFYLEIQIVSGEKGDI